MCCDDDDDDYVSNIFNILYFIYNKLNNLLYITFRLISAILTSHKADYGL